ncbi:MAG: substrate-binding domain-containing protein [Candidatus Izemoplasmatales bacterium]|nr:substrate-binding domain-containing protein [Candidatus Izemoplasmatales bacterium]MDD4070353.1 substrate-binding domain-containing protein [Candidatus Izemoplasmatales bacterium]
MKKSLILLSLLFIGSMYACTSDKTTEVLWDSTSNISLYTRDTSSGTRAGFMAGIGFDDAAEDDSLLADQFVIKDNTGILTSMATDEYGIGYISLASLDDSVKGLNFDGVEPTIENVVNNTYGLKRPFNFVIRDLNDFANDTEKEITLAFIAFLGTTDGADIITNEGAIPLESTESWDDIKEEHDVCNLDNSGITIKFGGSDSIEKIALALTESFSPKCGNFVPEHDHTGSSDGFKRTQGSEKDGDNYKHVGFASRLFKDSENGAEGTQGQLAWDAIVAIVHLNNEVDSVSAEDLKKIYSGVYTTWDQLLN